MARQDALQGSLPLLLLKLLDRRGALHGYAIATRIEGMSDAGISRDAAAADVARRFGNPLRLREQSLDVKLLPWLDSMVRDIRLGARMLRRNAVVTGAALLSLSLALGACVAAFSLVDAL